MVSRRNFLGSVLGLSERKGAVNSSLEEFKNPLTRQQVKHLLNRTTFSISPAVIDKYVGKTADEVVNILFVNARSSMNPTPPHYVNDVLLNPNNQSGNKKQQEQDKLDKHSGEYNWENGAWWVYLMKTDRESILEKMVLFWHGHLTTQYADDISIPALPMYFQNDMFRKNFAGNFYRILEKITIDGAMLVYLNGDTNVKGAANENFARELMELYSLGVGNYTEEDVKEAAKILTGWKVKYFADESSTPNKGYFNPPDFDPNSKKFFDTVFQVDYEVNQENVFKHSVGKLIETILNKKGDVSARFMMRKLYKYFVYANPDAIDENIINQLADLLVKSGFEFEPVLKTMLKSQHFFDEKNYGIQLKSPADTIINVISHFKYVDLYARNVMMTLGLELFNPPNVSGWKGYRNWVSTKSLPTTIYYIHEIFSFNTNKDFSEWADSLDTSGNREKLTKYVLEIFFGKEVSEERLKDFTGILAGSDSEWQSLRSDKNQSGKKVKELMEMVIKSPEFYLF